MNHSFRSLFQPAFIVFGALPTALCVLYVALLILAVIVRGQFLPLPEDAVAINLDPLQSLAFLLAWTGLVGAVTVEVSNKIRDVLRNVEEATRLSHATREALDRLGLCQSDASNKPTSKSDRRTLASSKIARVVGTIQFIGEQPRRWHAWFYLMGSVVLHPEIAVGSNSD